MRSILLSWFTRFCGIVIAIYIGADKSVIWRSALPDIFNVKLRFKYCPITLFPRTLWMSAISSFVGVVPDALKTNCVLFPAFTALFSSSLNFARFSSWSVALAILIAGTPSPLTDCAVIALSVNPAAEEAVVEDVLELFYVFALPLSAFFAVFTIK